MIDQAQLRWSSARRRERASPIAMVIMVSFLFLLGLGRPAAALHFSGTTTFHDLVYPMTDEPFGFLPGGHMDVALQLLGDVDETGLRFLVCSSAQIAVLNANFNAAGALCNAIETVLCFENAPIQNGSYSLSANVSTKDVYYLLIANCDSEVVHIAYTFDFVNPGGEQLPYGEIPLPKALTALTVFWLVALVGYVLNAMRFFTMHIPLHSLIGVSGVAKMAAVIAAAWYWYSLSRAGSVDMTQFAIYKVAGIIGRLFGLAVLILVSHGYCVTVATLSWATLRVVGFSVTAVGAALLAWAFGGSYIAFLVLILYVLVIRHVFGTLFVTLRQLQTQMQIVRAGGIDPHTSPVALKRRAMEQVQVAVVLWLFVIVFANIVAVFFWAGLEWVSSVGGEAADLLLFCMLAYIFRLRDFSAYDVASACDPEQGRARRELSSEDEDSEYTAVLLPARNVEANAVYHSGMPLRPWAPGMALPNNPGFTLTPALGGTGQPAVVLFPLAWDRRESDAELVARRSTVVAIAEVLAVPISK
eukprot:c16186_g1_i1.p1 GENE.c16186_g1_i1~~c16186_g1_i1.p1  ORF type:complete len:608 (+),score=97.90 c16186_g1_i1:240-1826(+)